MPNRIEIQKTHPKRLKPQRPNPSNKVLSSLLALAATLLPKRPSLVINDEIWGHFLNLHSISKDPRQRPWYCRPSPQRLRRKHRSFNLLSYSCTCCREGPLHTAAIATRTAAIDNIDCFLVTQSRGGHKFKFWE